jgi:patatin-related protein
MTYQREVRLGLVLYGGVSLAVYENGVAQELYRATRGEGIYGLAAKLIDSDIVIDIISGTSAGGVNGIMLGYALANKRTFAPSAELWRDQGDIQALLRKQNDTDGSSILDSDYYQQKLASCFKESLTPDPAAPDIGELDLFVTSTDANGRISTVFDDLGHAIDIKNHRALFKLAFRKIRKNDLTAPPQQLAKLCRMTSCFPAAFQPVSVAKEEADFLRWGKLRDAAVYLDGGILNNKPFTSTIEAIAYRTATREVERFLIYVEPKPEQFSPSPEMPPTPSMSQAAFSSLVSIPSYQSIAGDLEAIEAHNERAARLTQILESLPQAPRSSPECLEKTDVLGEERESDQTAYYTARLVQLRDMVVECILNDKKGRGYFPAKETESAPPEQANGRGAQQAKVPWQDARRSGRILVQSFNAWPGDGCLTLQRYDIFFRMRRAKHLADTLMRAVKAEMAVPPAAWAVVNHYFKLYEMMKWAMVSWVNRWDFDWKSLSSDYPSLDTEPKDVQAKILADLSIKIWTQVENRLRALLQSDIHIPSDQNPDTREKFYRKLADRLDDTSPSQNHENSLLDAIDYAFEYSLLRLSNDADPAMVEPAGRLRDEFCHFLEVDRQLFLLQEGAGFESMDMIRVVRFSPLDAQRCLSKGRVKNKVRGSALASFGGFFNRSWRANDIMMGRLDAACLLVECLLTKERLAALAARRSKNPVSVSALELQNYFPNLGAEAVELSALINDYLSAPGTATDDQWNRLIDHIVCAGHDEIQREEWPVVVACAIEQEYDWGRYRQNTKSAEVPFDTKNLVWNRSKARPDEVLVQVAAKGIAAKTIPPFAPGENDSGNFLDEIPDSVLNELGALTAIRLGKGLLASIRDEGMRQRVEDNAFFKFLFRWIAPVFYNWGRMRRTQPDTVIIFNTAIPVFCLTALAMDIVLAFLGVRLEYRTWGLIVGGPALLLWIWGWLFRR